MYLSPNSSLKQTEPLTNVLAMIDNESDDFFGGGGHNSIELVRTVKKHDHTPSSIAHNALQLLILFFFPSQVYSHPLFFPRERKMVCR